MEEFIDSETEGEAQDIELQNLGARLKELYREYKDARRDIEDEWLVDLRQYNGQYEPDVLARLCLRLDSGCDWRWCAVWRVTGRR